MRDTKSTPGRQAVSYYSLDFDGCLFHKRLHGRDDRQEPDAIIDANEPLLNKIAANRHETVIMIGSNRQSYFRDQDRAIANKSPAGFAAYPLIAKQTGSVLDPLLLADIYNKQSPGVAFGQYQSLWAWFVNQFSCRYIDHHKLLMLYAQMHKAAKDQGNDVSIEFNFYDDRYDVILKPLGHFLLSHPGLLPYNTQLNLYCYNGSVQKSQEAGSLVFQVNGRGSIDADYARTVRRATLAIVNEEPETLSRTSTLKSLDSPFIAWHLLNTDKLDGSDLAMYERIQALKKDLQQAALSDGEVLDQTVFRNPDHEEMAYLYDELRQLFGSFVNSDRQATAKNQFLKKIDQALYQFYPDLEYQQNQFVLYRSQLIQNIMGMLNIAQGSSSYNIWSSYWRYANLFEDIAEDTDESVSDYVIG